MCKKAIIVVFLLSLVAIPTAVFGDDLVAHWEFDDNANDSSSNGYDGTIYGDPCFVTGQALRKTVCSSFRPPAKTPKPSVPLPLFFPLFA